MSSQNVFDRYKLPRRSVNVEALAQQLAYYFKITAEDTQFLSKHATRRDELFAKLYKQPGVKPNVAPTQFVPLGDDPDIHLIPANAEIERLTPPKTIEDRVARLHYAAAAVMVYNQYKVIYALFDHADLRGQVTRRKRQIMDEFYNGEFVRLFPELAKRTSGTPATAPTRARLPTPPPTRRSGVPKRVSNDEIEQFLRSPATLVGTRFVRSSPQGQGEDDSGAWEVISYMVKKVDGGVDHEYQVLLHDQAFGEDSVMMDKEEVQHLLQHSTLLA